MMGRSAGELVVSIRKHLSRREFRRLEKPCGDLMSNSRIYNYDLIPYADVQITYYGVASLTA